MKEKEEKMHFPKIDDFFTTQEERDEQKLEKVEKIAVSSISNFPNHPYQVKDNEEMEDFVENIKQKGVIPPVIVRSKEDGTYEMISGHRRKRACELAGIKEIPAIVRDMSDEDAIIYMVDSNKQREKILPSEKAFAYKMKLEAMKRQGQRNDLETSSPTATKLNKSTAEIIGEDFGEGRDNVYRYIRLTELIPELLQLVDDESEISDVAKKTKHIVVNNEQLEAYIKLIKKDIKTEKIVTLSSSTFEIKATKDIYDRATRKIIWKKGEAISQKIGSTTYKSFTTNADNMIVPENSYTNKNDDKGTSVTPLQLPVGSYAIYEINTPKGFLQLEIPVTFDIKGIRDYDKDQDEDFIKEVVIKNEQPTGTLIIDKSIALRKDVDKSIIDVSDLSGIEFKLTAKEDIIDYADGSKIYSKGQEVKTYNLEKNGCLKVESLPMGTYELEETKTLNGLVLNDKKYEIKFEQEDLIKKVYEVNEDISNDTTIFEFSKKDITGDEIEGAKLQVIDENGNIIDEWTSTKEPHIVNGLEENQKYKLVEITAPYGYELTEEIEFVVTTDKETQLVEMKDMPILKDIKVIKIDCKTKEIIKEKFSFGIYEDEECNNLIKEVKSSKVDGYIVFENLRYGTYYIKETKSPSGYELSDKIVKLEINDNGVLVDGTLIEEIDSVYGFEFENTEIEVPNTGDSRYTKILIFIGGISAISLIGIVVYDYKKRKNKV